MNFENAIIVYFLVVIVGFFISLYIFRAIFNIPKFLRLQKAQLKLLEQMAKTQGVEEEKVSTIMKESAGWETI